MVSSHRAREVRHRERGAEEVFRDEVPVDAALDCLRDAVKAQERARHFAVDGVGRPRERRAPERHDVHARPQAVKAVDVAQEHFGVRVEVLPAVDRLRLPKMGEAGHDVFGRLFGAGKEHGDERLQGVDGAIRGAARVQAEIGRDLVVARARRVQLFARLPDAGDELVLHEGVDVLLPFDGERSRLDVRADGFESRADGVRFLACDDAALTEHGGVGDGRGDVRAPEFFVERERLVECVRVCRGGRVKSSFPKFHTVSLPRRAAYAYCTIFPIRMQALSGETRPRRAKFLTAAALWGTIAL